MLTNKELYALRMRLVEELGKGKKMVTWHKFVTALELNALFDIEG